MQSHLSQARMRANKQTVIENSQDKGMQTFAHMIPIFGDSFKVSGHRAPLTRWRMASLCPERTWHETLLCINRLSALSHLLSCLIRLSIYRERPALALWVFELCVTLFISMNDSSEKIVNSLMVTRLSIDAYSSPIGLSKATAVPMDIHYTTQTRSHPKEEWESRRHMIENPHAIGTLETTRTALQEDGFPTT